jgi:hypothetical protein
MFGVEDQPRPPEPEAYIAPISRASRLDARPRSSVDRAAAF